MEKSGNHPILCLFFAVLALCSPIRAAAAACPSCPPMVEIPPGSFTMGDDAAFSSSEKPSRTVRIERPFLLSRTEITFAQWQGCVADKACPGGQDDHKWGRGDRPVINVTWADAAKFAAWVGRKSGLSCRLPSEAEWEYAARGGKGSAFPWGDTVGKDQANCRDCRSGGIIPYGSLPAASFPANGFGLHDTSGNVWEWVADCWHPDHRGAPADGTVRTAETCRDRVIKGGSWYYYSTMSRPAARSKNPEMAGSYNIGLRVLCEPK